VRKSEWWPEVERLGLIDPLSSESDTKAAACRRALISKYRTELIGAGWIAMNGEFVWSIR